jgi:lexA repressor
MNNSTSQQKIFELIKSYHALHGNIPSLGYIADHMGYKHKSNAQYHVAMLRESGMLDNLDAPRMVEIPLLGNISCGPALLAEENVQAYVPIEANSLKSRNTKDYFFLKAEGDSMNNAGIIEGDLVLIRKQSQAPWKSIVVALIGDDATLKQLDKTKDGFPVLVPNSTNTIHKPRIMIEDFSILGIMERVIPSARRMNM